MKAVMTTFTYIQWRGDTQKSRKDFWSQMNNSLSEVITSRNTQKTREVTTSTTETDFENQLSAPMLSSNSNGLNPQRVARETSAENVDSNIENSSTICCNEVSETDKTSINEGIAFFPSSVKRHLSEESCNGSDVFTYPDITEIGVSRIPNVQIDSNFAECDQMITSSGRAELNNTNLSLL